MPRSLTFATIMAVFAAFSAVAQSQDSNAPAPPAPSQDSATPVETKKPKKVWTNENLLSHQFASSWTSCRGRSRTSTNSLWI